MGDYSPQYHRSGTPAVEDVTGVDEGLGEDVVCDDESLKPRSLPNPADQFEEVPRGHLPIKEDISDTTYSWVRSESDPLSRWVDRQGVGRSVVRSR